MSAHFGMQKVSIARMVRFYRNSFKFQTVWTQRASPSLFHNLVESALSRVPIPFSEVQSCAKLVSFALSLHLRWVCVTSSVYSSWLHRASFFSCLVSISACCSLFPMPNLTSLGNAGPVGEGCRDLFNSAPLIWCPMLPCFQVSHMLQRATSTLWCGWARWPAKVKALRILVSPCSGCSAPGGVEGGCTSRWRGDGMVCVVEQKQLMPSL